MVRIPPYHAGLGILIILLVACQPVEPITEPAPSPVEPKETIVGAIEDAEAPPELPPPKIIEPEEPEPEPEPESDLPEHLTADDGARIAYTYYPSEEPKPYPIILLHMLNQDRTTYDSFAKFLQGEGYAVIAIDFRGHGESGGDWRRFSEKDFNRMKFDVKAAKEFMMNQSWMRAELGIVGASIGANVALNYAATDPDVQTVVLLSPSLNYRGVKTEDTVRQYTGGVFILVAKGDEQSIGGSQTLHQRASGAKEMKVYQGSEHGTNLLGQRGSDDAILRWLNRLVR